ncbi:MAG: hypothetical protein KDJ87_00960 [Rhizobiaceae bacterium]|nr:hypothetical protein [Rhizobiaceae bacterium]
MADIETMPRQAVFLPELLMTIFLRLVAAGCLWFGFRIWSDLIGYGSGGALRIDLLDTDQQAAVACLAVLYPIAAIGLWLRGSWGPVVWTLAAAVEIARHETLAGSFIDAAPTLLAIAATVPVYIALRLTLWLRKPPRTEPNFAQR